MNIQKEAGVCRTGVPDAGQLEKINRFSKSPLTEDQVYCFSVRLCDDQPDRDYERFDTAALPVLGELFRGKTGIADHEWSSDRQIARIFDTEVVEKQGVTWLRGDCYVLRTDKNAELIADIEGGIKKEVSVGCAVAETRCSICGGDYGACEHQKGAVYDGKLCTAVLCDPTDAYEFSFVAVPAQKEAGVLKALEGGVSMTLQELVKKSGSPAMADSLRTLEQEAAFGRDCRKELLEETVSLGVLLDFGPDRDLLRKSFGNLSADELRRLRKSMGEKAAALYPSGTQLPTGEGKPAASQAAYMI